MKSLMSGPDAVALLKLFADNQLHVWVDGGWGIDALIGHQTRPHDDLDIALQHKDVHKLRWVLGLQGYSELERDDTRESNFVLADGHGHQVDVHTFTFDSEGNNIFGVPYQPQHLTGEGSIEGYSVNCLPPDVMMSFKTGYDVDENDYHDVKMLSEHFALPIPPLYNKFKPKTTRKTKVPRSQDLARRATELVRPVKVADYYIGDVAAAIVSVNGRIFTGVAVGGHLAVCAEQAALTAMATAGEYRFTMAVAAWKDDQGRAFVIPPCGRCREFMYQLHRDNLEAEIVLGRDHAQRLSELLPLAGRPAEPID